MKVAAMFMEANMGMIMQRIHDGISGDVEKDARQIADIFMKGIEEQGAVSKENLMQLIRTIFKSLKWNLVPAVMLGGLLLGGCDSAERAQPPRPVPEVAVITLQEQRVVLTTELPGRTAAFRMAEIRPQVSGLIQRRMFKEGSDVKAGQALYQIDSAPFRAVLDNADAALGRAEASLYATQSRASRFEKLVAIKAVSRQDYDDAAAALKQTEADIEYWKAMVKTARINLGLHRDQSDYFWTHRPVQRDR